LPKMDIQQSQTHLERCFHKSLRPKLSFANASWTPELTESWAHEPLAIFQKLSIEEINKIDQRTRTTVRFGGSGGLF
jgi:hypothetical protein